MSTKKPAPGETIEGRCTRCRAPRNHTIVAMVGERVARVRCNTCGGEHNYHPLVAAAAPRAPRATASKPATPRPGKDPGAADRAAWTELRAGFRLDRAVSYAMDGRFKLNDLIDHPSFGLGQVQRVVPGKIEVLFESGRKLLRCR